MATYPTNPPGDTLQAIQTKVRRLTRSISESQLTTDDLNNYINTFVIYDFPEHLRTFNLRQEFSFICNPFQDTYPTDELLLGGITSNQLFNFQNLVISVHDPVYIAGYQSFYTQSQERFYSIYPQTNSIQSIGVTGDGVTTTFSGILPIIQNQTVAPATQVNGACIRKGSVLFSSVDINNNGAALIDVPIVDANTGNQTVWGNLYTPQIQQGSWGQFTIPNTVPQTVPTATAPYTLVAGGTPNSNNYINYVTGAFTITFPVAPASGEIINCEFVPSVVSLPQAILYFQNQFVLRPIPDQPYRINFEVYMRPTQLFQLNSVPQLEEYWQYIAYGAAKKIFEDRMDMESVQLIIPEFHKQQAMVQRRTIVQYTNERTATIYTEQTSGPGWGGNGWGWGGGPF